MRKRYLAKGRRSGFGRIGFFAALAISTLIGNSFSAVQPLDTFYGYGYQCRLAPYITTHWNMQSGGHEELGTGRDADMRYILYPKNNSPLVDTLKPAFNNYHEMMTASTPVNTATTGDDSSFNMENPDALVHSPNNIADAIDRYALEFRKRILLDTAHYYGSTFLDILNYGNFSDPLFGLTEDNPNVQILNNAILWSYDHQSIVGLATVTFPPFWTRSKKYPVFLHGNGSGVHNLNQQYVGAVSYSDALMAAGSAKVFQNAPTNSNAGTIIVYVNNGGRESHGTNEGLLNGIAFFFRNVIPQYGGDTTRILTAGGSRGGVEAAVWGAMPDPLHVRAIFSAVAPIKLGSTARLSPATFPGLASSANLNFGSTNAWKYGFGGLDQTGKAQAFTKIICGSNNLDSADTIHSIYGIYKHANKDSLRHKFIQFAYGSRDACYPLGYFLEFDKMLSDSAVPHSSFISYNIGHRADYSYEFWQSEGSKMLGSQAPGPYTGTTRTFLLLDTLFTNEDSFPHKGNIRILDARLIETMDSLRPNYFVEGKYRNPEALGFSANMPYLAIQDKPFEIALSGEHHKKWKIWARPENGYAQVFSAEGAFGDSVKTSLEAVNSGIAKENGFEFAILRNLKFTVPGTLEWFFEYDGKEIPNRFTPNISSTNKFLRAVTRTVAEDDYSVDTTALRFFRPERQTVSNGVDQIHTLLLHPNDTGHFTGLPTSMTVSKLHSSQNGKFSLDVGYYGWGSDADAQDTLRFDLRTQSGGYIDHGVMDRATGNFSIDTVYVPVGTHHLKALLSDGKGGVADADFTVQVTP